MPNCFTTHKYFNVQIMRLSCFNLYKIRVFFVESNLAYFKDYFEYLVKHLSNIFLKCVLIYKGTDE